MVGVRYVTYVLLALCVFLPASVFADDPFVTNSDNEIVKVLDFASDTTQVVIRDNGKKYEGIVLFEQIGVGGAADLQIIATSSSGGGEVIAYSLVPGEVVTSGDVLASFSSAGGTGADPSGNVYVANADPGGADVVLKLPRVSEVYGAGISVQLDGFSDLLTDVGVATATNGAFTAGDVVVASRKPAGLLRVASSVFDADGTVNCDGSNSDCEVVSSGFPAGAEPTAFVFDLQGSILVATWQDGILQFGSDGAFIGTFISAGDLPGNATGIAVASTDDPDVDELFVSIHGGGAVARYDIVNGTPDLDSVASAEIQAPVEVAVATGNAAYTPAGNDVELVVQNMAVTFDEVVTEGETSLLCASFVDPRAGADAPLYLCDPDGAGCPAGADFNVKLDTNRPGDGSAHFIPGHVRAFPVALSGQDGSTASGPETFRLCFASSTQSFERLARTKAKEDAWLGYEPNCDDSDLSMRPRFYYSEDEAPAIIEGNVFVHDSARCNDDERWGSRWGALFLSSVRDLRGLNDIVGFKFQALRDALDSEDESAGGIGHLLSKKLANALGRHLNCAENNYNRERPDRSIACLVKFENAVLGAKPGDIGSNTFNAAGQLLQRPGTIRFDICDARFRPADNLPSPFDTLTPATEEDNPTLFEQCHDVLPDSFGSHHD